MRRYDVRMTIEVPNGTTFGDALSRLRMAVEHWEEKEKNKQLIIAGFVRVNAYGRPWNLLTDTEEPGK